MEELDTPLTREQTLKIKQGLGNNWSNNFGQKAPFFSNADPSFKFKAPKPTVHSVSKKVRVLLGSLIRSLCCGASKYPLLKNQIWLLLSFVKKKSSFILTGFEAGLSKFPGGEKF